MKSSRDPNSGVIWKPSKGKCNAGGSKENPNKMLRVGTRER